MKNQDGKCGKNTDCSRRQFLTISGKLAIGIGTGLPALISACSGSGGGSTDADSESGPTTAVYRASEGYLLVLAQAL